MYTVQRVKTAKRYKYNIGGKTYSKARLQAEWTAQCSMLKTKPGKSTRVGLQELTDPAVAQWYIAAAWVTGSMLKRKLFPADAESLEQAIANTAVLVGRSDSVPSRTFGKEPSRHVFHCIFFQNKQDSVEINAAPKALCGNTAKVRKTSRQKLTAQYRAAIESQILRFRHKQSHAGFVKCMKCEEVVANKDAHVDHGIGENSFASLMEQFLLGFARQEIPFNGTTAISAWQTYHEKNCKLEMFCAKCNLSQGRHGKN